MWVRTQDRLALANLDNCDGIELNVEEDNDICVVRDRYIQHCQLGVYSTKERCLEVLDEIQQHIIGKIIISKKENVIDYDLPQTSIYKTVEFNEIQHLPIVYQMPED